MNSEKGIFKVLKWLFSFFIGIMVVAAGGLAILIVIFNFTSIPDLSTVSINSLPFGAYTFDILSSPIFLLLLIANILLYGILFYFVRSFFKNLEMDQIFVRTNVSTAKKIAGILLLLSVTSCLPDIYASMQGFAIDSAAIDLTYIVGASIVWALAKILEKANMIAEENELTI
ncbi:DUF2975 domain-containing protein [Candidatus Enterococcus murrayae]|uniref:DUF2975 domain-containing protein n=1 Tax=Candidatus Enterococcus murrayae TaxID=2815321 RepID=A0ABS3HLP7_9ENTE|nr:DUF2975 domain-containing protein [Enterococcus sp. MJM16]MBO0453932.1 DUF2975 domain-containing protein [Enterococcus sp. MJM16]